MFVSNHLLPYAPDLNPVEHVWKHTKYDELANYIPDDLLDLENCVRVVDRPDLSAFRTVAIVLSCG